MDPWLLVSAGLSSWLGAGCGGALATAASTPPEVLSGAFSESTSSVQPAGEKRARRVGASEGGRLPGGSWGWLEARPFPLLVPVPDAAAWSVIERGRWFVAQHRASDSTLAVRVWSAARRVSRDQCEAELLLGRPELRRLDGVSLVEEREGIGPEGFHSRVRVWGEGVGRGVALATGAAPGRCWAVVFRTRASPAELGRRLRLATDGTLSRMRWQSLQEAYAPSRAPLPFD